MGYDLNNRQVKLKMLTTPIIDFLGRKNFYYRLLDGAYGEWLVFEDNVPKYYFNFFDEEYASFKQSLPKFKMNLENYLNECFKKKNMNLTTRQYMYGFKLKGKEEVRIIVIEKMPANILEE